MHRKAVWDRIFANVPFDLRPLTFGTFLTAAPPGTWTISASRLFVAYADGFIADPSTWSPYKPAF